MSIEQEGFVSAERLELQECDHLPRKRAAAPHSHDHLTPIPRLGVKKKKKDIQQIKKEKKVSNVCVCLCLCVC